MICKMSTADFRFYEELNDFLPRQYKKVCFEYCFNGCRSIKDMIEAIGVPHTEIDLILVNGKSVDFSYLVADGDHISVYPVFESIDISPLVRLRPQPLRSIRFILDLHLGKLARYLRLLGFDTYYNNNLDDASLAQRSADEQRILLTRDCGLLKRRIVTHGFYIRQIEPSLQVREVITRLDLFNSLQPFSRCLKCNGILKTVGKHEIVQALEPNTSRYFDHFRRCKMCGHIYWRGGHYERMLKFIQKIERANSTQAQMH